VIIVAADSYQTNTSLITVPHGFFFVTTTELICKIRQMGDVFFSAVNILSDGDFNVWSMASVILNSTGTLESRIARFDAEMERTLPAVMVRLRNKHSPEYTNRIGKSVSEVVVATMDGKTPVMFVRYYMSSLLTSGDVLIEARGTSCPGDDCPEGVRFAATGEHRAIDAQLEADSALWDQDAAALAKRLRGYVQLEIDEFPEKLDLIEQFFLPA
jgi:hypothetical protein